MNTWNLSKLWDVYGIPSLCFRQGQGDWALINQIRKLWKRLITFSRIWNREKVILHKEYVGDVLMVIVKNSGDKPDAERKGNVARVFL